MKYQKLTGKQILEILPELNNFLSAQNIKGNNKLIVNLYVGGKVEIRPCLYDYTVRYMFLKNGSVEKQIYAGCSDNLQDVFAHTGGEFNNLPANGLVAILDNHGGQGLKWLTVYLGNNEQRNLSLPA